MDAHTWSPEVTKAHGTAAPGAPRFAIQTRGLRKAYGKDEARVEALRGIDLDIAVGEFTSIMGPSGSGKSTLLHLIGLLDAPTDGGVRIMGRTASHFNAKQRTLARRRHLGFVFQSFHLMPRTSAIQNVMLPMALAGVPRRHRVARAEAVLRAVGLGDRMRHRPSQLSGGQKQRVAIARALALDPAILLADEPTGNLDSATSQDIMLLFQQLNRRGKTIVQVTHAPEMARYGRRVVHVQDGLLAPPPGRSSLPGTPSNAPGNARGAQPGTTRAPPPAHGGDASGQRGAKSLGQRGGEPLGQGAGSGDGRDARSHGGLARPERYPHPPKSDIPSSNRWP